jgi:hypothetical protein
MKSRELKIEDGGWQTRSVVEYGGKRSAAVPAAARSTSQKPVEFRALIRQSGPLRVGHPRSVPFGQSGSFALLVLIALFFMAAFALHAQQYSINWFKVAGGGGTSTGGTYQVSGTIGQTDAGGPMTGGSYSLTGGFWSVISVVQMPGAPLLMIALNSQPPTVTVSWPASATNYVLQQNSDLATANWTAVGLPVSTNGATLSVTISPPAGNLFFRLNSP